METELVSGTYFGVLGVTGAVVLMFAHGLSIALLFGMAGELRRRTGTLVFDELGGLARVMPFAGLAFGIGVFAAIGLPGFANFAGEIMIFFGAFRNGWEIGRFHIFQIVTRARSRGAMAKIACGVPAAA